MIDGETLDAVSEGMVIEPEQPVYVVDVRGNRIVVRLDDRLNESQSSDDGALGDDLLSQPAESLGLESLEDPLA